MICSRCHARNIPGDAVVSPNCGGTLVSDEAPQPPMPEELERALKRDLGGQFQINELLGRGGMSLVYLAYELQLNRPVALKVLPLQLAYGPDAVERFEREAKIAAALDHPHIVPIYRVGATGTFLWYSMKRVKGRSLAEILEQSGTLSLEETIGILDQAGSALQYAHRHGVVHRDVKPANIMIEDSGWVLVCDFCVAKAFGNVGLTESCSSVGPPGAARVRHAFVTGGEAEGLARRRADAAHRATRHDPPAQCGALDAAWRRARGARCRRPARVEVAERARRGQPRAAQRPAGPAG